LDGIPLFLNFDRKMKQASIPIDFEADLDKGVSTHSTSVVSYEFGITVNGFCWSNIVLRSTEKLITHMETLSILEM
jgi:hypothetical protein